MIRYLTRSKIDAFLYDDCVSKSINSRVYGYSWYLDAVCDTWDVLVLDDYSAVMPLPKRVKYGINYIYQAPWIQQLGIFSKKAIQQVLLYEFIQHIPKKIKLIDVLLNSENILSNSNSKVLDNYILSLNAEFETIKSNYNTNRKRISKSNFSTLKIDRNGKSVDFLSLYKNQKLSYKRHKDSFEKLEALVKLKNDYINIWIVLKRNKIIGGLLWLKDKHRITYLVPVTTSLAKKENASTFLVNELIKEHANTNRIFDFEGSMVAGVANFYKSFGAKKESYYQFKKYRLL